MKVLVMNKETNEEIFYNGVIAYDVCGAIDKGNGYEPVFQLIFDNNETATFHKSEWDLFIVKRV